MPIFSGIPRFSLSVSGESRSRPYDDDNTDMDFGNVTTPRTPAKSRSHGDIPSHSSSALFPLSYQNDATDAFLAERFNDVDLIGKGEFSLVYAASEKQNAMGIEPVRYAIKKTKAPFKGTKSRARFNEEAEILKSLSETQNEGREYIINMFDAWEHQGHLYIMTEYCENGSLDSFLSERGNVSRLDEWRVWKILVEITLVSFFLLLGNKFDSNILGFAVHS